MTEEINDFDIINKEEIESEILNTINSINNEGEVRKNIKKILNKKNYKIGTINDEIILALSDFYIKRNKNGDSKIAEECLDKVLNKENPKYLLCKAEILELEGKYEEAINKYQNCIINFYPLKKIKEISECFAEIAKLTGNYNILKKLELFFKIIDSNVPNDNITLNDIKSAFEIYFKFAEKVINNILEEENNQNKEQELNNIFKNIKDTINMIKEISPENIKSDTEKYFKISEIVIVNVLDKNNQNKEQKLNNLFIDINGNTPENIKLFVETYFKFSEIEMENILEKSDLNKEQELNNIFINIGNIINAIEGDFSEINGIAGNDLFSSDFYTFVSSRNSDFIMENPSYEFIKMLEAFVRKGSVDCYGFLYNSCDRLKKPNQNIINLINNKENLLRECYSKYKSHFFAMELLPFVFKKGNRDEIKEVLKEYKERLELLRQSDPVNFKNCALELTRVFNNIVLDKDIEGNYITDINLLKSYEKEIKDLCDFFPYGFDYGNENTMDYYEIMLNKREFDNIFENYKLDCIKDLYENEYIENMSFNDFMQSIENIKKKEENIKERENELKNNTGKSKDEVIKINKQFIDDRQKLEREKVIVNSMIKNLPNLLEKIINNKNLEYFIFINERSKFDRMKEMNNKFKINIEEITGVKILEKFEKNVNYINNLLNKNEIDENTKKEINRILNSLIKITDIILKKELKISEENKENLENLFNNLRNNDIFPISTIEVYKDILQKLENLFPNLKGKTEEVLEEKRKLTEFEHNLNFVNDLLIKEIDENNKQTLDEENKKKIENLMEFVKNTTDEKIENLKIYKKGLRILFKNLEESKNKLVVNEIKKYEKELEKLEILNNNILPENNPKQIE